MAVFWCSRGGAPGVVLAGISIYVPGLSVAVSVSLSLLSVYTWLSQWTVAALRRVYK